MGIHVSQIEPTDEFCGMCWRDLSQQIWSNEGAPVFQLIKNVCAERGIGCTEQLITQVAEQVDTRGLLEPSSILLSKYASSTAWERMSHEEVSELVLTLRERCEQFNKDCAVPGVQIDAAWVFGSAASRCKADVGDIDTSIQTRWIGSADASEDQIQTAMKKAIEYLHFDERLDIGWAIYLPTSAQNHFKKSIKDNSEQPFVLFACYLNDNAIYSQKSSCILNESKVFDSAKHLELLKGFSEQDRQMVGQLSRQNALQFGVPVWAEKNAPWLQNLENVNINSLTVGSVKERLSQYKSDRAQVFSENTNSMPEIATVKPGSLSI